MMKMTMKVRGLNKVLSNLDKLKYIIEADAGKGLESASNILRDGAIQKLESSIGTGRSWHIYRKSDDSIRDISNWKIYNLSPINIDWHVKVSMLVLWSWVEWEKYITLQDFQ